MRFPTTGERLRTALALTLVVGSLATFTAPAAADHVVGGATGHGCYAVVDTPAPMLAEWQARAATGLNLGPAFSRQFEADGMIHQEFQRGVLRWNPADGATVLLPPGGPLAIPLAARALALEGAAPPAGQPDLTVPRGGALACVEYASGSPRMAVAPDVTCTVSSEPPFFPGQPPVVTLMVDARVSGAGDTGAFTVTMGGYQGEGRLPERANVISVATTRDTPTPSGAVRGESGLLVTLTGLKVEGSLEPGHVWVGDGRIEPTYLGTVYGVLEPGYFGVIVGPPDPSDEAQFDRAGTRIAVTFDCRGVPARAAR